MRWFAVVVLCAGCGRTALPNTQDQQSALSDVPSVCGIERSAWSWSTPEIIPELPALIATLRTNANTSIFDPVTSDDGLALYVSADFEGFFQVFTLTRPSLSEPFDHIELGPADVNDAVTTFGYQPLSSLNIAMAFSNFPAQGFPQNTYVVALADSAEPPHTWHTIAVDSLRSGLQDPRLTGDGTGLILNSVYDASATLRGIFFSERATIADDFSTLVQFDTLSTGDDSAPWLSADRRVMFFAHADDNLDASKPTSDIWVATRSDPSLPFADAAPLDVLNTPYFDGEPYVFAKDGVCELYLVQNRPEPPGYWLYRSVMVP
jgi:hypothetical protein